MLNNGTTAVRQVLASAAMTAFQVAEVQQKRFEQTFEEVKDRNREVADRQEKAAQAQDRRVEEQRRAAEARRVARASNAEEPAPVKSEPQEAPAPASSGETRGGSVDLEV